jgi:uncharacterized protein with HEPN domain
MGRHSSIPRLTDIVEAIDLINEEMAGVGVGAFGPDKRKRWLVERGIEIISEASRHLGDDLKARHPEIPWHKVAAIGNVLRHDYQRVAHDVLWSVVNNGPARARAGLPGGARTGARQDCYLTAVRGGVACRRWAL